MKNTMKLPGTRSRRLCAVALFVALIGFVMASCGGGDGGSDSPGGGTTARLSGTYVLEDSMGFGAIVFSGSNFTMKLFGMDAARGTYRVTGGTTITFNVTWVNPEMDDGSGDENPGAWTIVDANTLRDEDGEYWRK